MIMLPFPNGLYKMKYLSYVQQVLVGTDMKHRPPAAILIFTRPAGREIAGVVDQRHKKPGKIIYELCKRL
jgi:hypothetical protein